MAWNGRIEPQAKFSFDWGDNPKLYNGTASGEIRQQQKAYIKRNPSFYDGFLHMGYNK